ncbi:winged helix domain-containing protein [Aliiroseovarius crassostreae]|uniref:winged helix domain-containing protein n=1 Tax=Aliiroseovarius crassostreae TaxID=154981 RepID=UPI0035CD3447
MTQATRFCVVPLGGGAQFEVVLKGRNAWALRQLVKAGTAGCTPVMNPAPRWSGYVHKIRSAGIKVETINERHEGPYPGNHARYVLVDAVQEVKAACDE